MIPRRIDWQRFIEMLGLFLVFVCLGALFALVWLGPR